MTDTVSTQMTLAQRRDAVLAIHQAAADEDWDAVLAADDPEIVWINDPGAGPWAGRFEGIDAVAKMFGEYLEFLGGTFTQEVLDVCVSDDRSMSFVVERGSKGGHDYENRGVWISRYANGLVVEVITVDLDRDQALDFWAAVTA